MALTNPAAIMAAVQAQRDLAAALFDQVRRDGADEPGVTRDPYGAGEQRAHATVAAAGAARGLTRGQDVAGNLYLSWAGSDPAAKSVIVGSHLDSVPHGGNFDGAAGVIAGLVAVAALQSLGATPRPTITVMGIRAEESVWFEVSYLGSRGALGVLPPGATQAKRRDTGRTLAAHMIECGGDPAAVDAGHRHLDPDRIAAFVELHIEQAPSLVASDRAVGICTGIPGNVRYPTARIIGQHDHVGLPRRFRHDAAMAGAAFAMELDQLWERYEARGIPMACTFGRFHTDAAVHGMTIVPGTFHFSLDVRAYDDGVLEALHREVLAIAAAVGERRGVTFELGPRAEAPVGKVSPVIRAGLEHSAAALGIPFGLLGSPASHDAAAFAACGVPVSMIFVRNENGSHNPREAMTLDDFLAGTAVLTGWLAEVTA